MATGPTRPGIRLCTGQAAERAGRMMVVEALSAPGRHDGLVVGDTVLPRSWDGEPVSREAAA